MRPGEGVMKEAENLQVRDTCKSFDKAGQAVVLKFSHTSRPF